VPAGLTADTPCLPVLFAEGKWQEVSEQAEACRRVHTSAWYRQAAATILPVLVYEQGAWARAAPFVN